MKPLLRNITDYIIIISFQWFFFVVFMIFKTLTVVSVELSNFIICNFLLKKSTMSSMYLCQACHYFTMCVKFTYTRHNNYQYWCVSKSHMNKMLKSYTWKIKINILILCNKICFFFLFNWMHKQDSIRSHFSITAS